MVEVAARNHPRPNPASITEHRTASSNAVPIAEYERLYRHDIATVRDLADFIDECNTIRPHETLGWQRPLAAHLDPPHPQPPPS
jgi:transposase InsO family protein